MGSQEVVLRVPYYSQRLDVKDKYWAPRACGIVALAMAMDYAKQQGLIAHSRSTGGSLRGFQPFCSDKVGDHAKMVSKSALRLVALSLQHLIHEGVSIGAYHDNYRFIHDADILKLLNITDGAGWIHDGLVSLAKRHGFKKSFRKEYGPEEAEICIRDIIELLQKSLPVLASIKKKSGGHLVVLSGFKIENIASKNSLTPSRTRSELYYGTARPHLEFLSATFPIEALKGFYFNDPDAKTRKSGANKFISINNFLKLWRRRIVVVK